MTKSYTLKPARASGKRTKPVRKLKLLTRKRKKSAPKPAKRKRSVPKPVKVKREKPAPKPAKRKRPVPKPVKVKPAKRKRPVPKPVKRKKPAPKPVKVKRKKSAPKPVPIDLPVSVPTPFLPAVEYMADQWDGILEELRSNGQLPETPPAEFFRNSEALSGVVRTVELYVNLHDEGGVAEVMYQIAHLATSLERDYPDRLHQGVWMCEVTLAAYGSKLIPYGLIMVSSLDVNLRQIQARGIVSSGVQATAERMVAVIEEDLEKRVEDSILATVLFASVYLLVRKSEEEQKKHRREREKPF